MFRIESYVTSIILSYVDRYIKNFKRQDAQVSLWEGDGSLHNLDLDLEVLDQELNLPFSFVSGHIHELLIHVPWTRIASEPVKITINTIECIMKLKPPGQENVVKKDKKKKAQTGDECVTPPSYMSSLVNKIIFNLSVTCNNLILKYVEEDIVLSMNIKTLSLSTVNKQWMPEFSDLSAAQLILRNLVNLSDVTICLDKRNASGRIETYMDPILYKCSLTIRISRSFPSPGCTIASTTRIGIKCDSFALSISQPQVPMLIRLAMLLKSIVNSPPASNATSQLSLDNDDSSLASDGDGQYQSWSSWMWGFVPSILPVGDDSTMSNFNENFKALHFGLYVSNCVLDMKLIEEGKSWQSLGRIQLEDLFFELSKNNNDWTNQQLGICVLSVLPAPQFDNEQYVACGRPNPDLMANSLFENPDTDFPQRLWDVHLSSVTENDMVNRAPALAMDSLSVVEILPDSWTDNFYNESREKALTRFVCGPLDVNVTIGLLDRIRVIIDSVMSYDYPMPAPPSGGPTNDFAPVKDKYFNDCYIPKEITQFTLCEASVRVYAAQIPLPGKRGKKNLNAELIKTYSTKQHPHLLLKVKCLDVNLTRPLNPDLLKGLVLRNPPMEIFSEAMTTLSAGIMKVSASVLVGDTEVIDILDVSKISSTMAYDSALQIAPDSISCHRTLQIGELSVSTSKAKLLLAINVVESYLVEDIKTNPIYNSSLVQDSMNFVGVPFLKFTLSGFHFMFVSSQVNESYKVRFGSLSGQTFYYGENNARPKSTVLTSGSTVSKNIFEGIAQRPLSELNTAPFLFYIKLKQLHVNLDQSLVDWILYKPKQMSNFRTSRLGSGSVTRKISSSSLSSLSKKPSTTIENVESLEKILEKENSREPPQSTTIEDYEKTEKKISMWLSLIVSTDITDVAFTYSTSSTGNYSIVFKIPSISVSTNYGKLGMDCDELPVIFSGWIKSATSFPWTVDINGINAYSIINGSQPKQTVLEPFSINCTIAVTSKFTPGPVVAVTIHTDTSSINVAAGRHEISALMDLIACTSLVVNSLTQPKKLRKNDELAIELNQSSDDSCSRSRSQSVPANQAEPKGSTNVDSWKVSCWLQWTLAKLTFSLYTSTTSVTNIDDLKLGADFEDIIVSSDMDINARVYQKLKMKIGTASVKYYSREFKHFPWKLGSFGGIVMRGHEFSDNNTQFLSLTLTRVLASHYHSKLSNVTHQIKESIRQRTTPLDRYVMEIDLKLEPLDFVLSPLVLGKFYQLYEPILSRKTPDLAPMTANSAPLDQFTTADLPLVYLDIEQIRIFLPASMLQSEKSDDTVVIVIDDVALRHEAVNPVTRRILRSDIYSSAQRARVTALPGSQLEDRQYQLDTTLHVSTGVWEELAPHVHGEESTGPDNPAVYWNSVRGHPQNGAGLTPLMSPPVKICLILAPPIVTSGFVVSGLNFEVNIISEMSISLCLEQLRLLNHLIIECKSILPETLIEHPDYSGAADSGLESAESSIITPVSKPKVERIYRRANSSLISVSSSTPVNTKNLRQKIHTVPRDILFIGKSITLKLYSKDSRNSRTQPLLYILVAQPFVSLEKHGDTCVHKASIFDLSARIGRSEYFTTSTRFDADDYPEAVIVTKDGDPDPYKGIPPALFNFKMTQVGMKLPVVDVEIARPIKLSCKLCNVEFLESVQLLVLDSLDERDYGNKNRFECGDSPRKLETIKEAGKFPQYFSSFNLSSKQVVLEFLQSSPVKRSVIFSISSMSSFLNIPSPNHIYGTLNVTAIVLSVVFPSFNGPRPLITPWTLSLTGNLIREPWIASPLLTVQLSSDILEIEYSPKRFDILRDTLEELRLLVAQRRKVASSLVDDEESAKESHKADEEDQFYKDDLQAGAFQFVNSEPPPELPLAYQVIFPSSQVMAWAYPQPRCITSITVLPVPFRDSESEEVEVCLQYLDFLGWKDWIKFTVSESEVAEVDLPAKARVASTWRVVIKSNHSPIDAQALAASLRVDSMFSGSLVPNVRFNLGLDCFQVSVWAGPTHVMTLPPPLTRFAPENPIPGEYPFAKASVEQIKLRLLSWRSGSLEIEGDLRARVDLVNCRTLQEQCCVQPFPVHVNFESDTSTQSVSLTAGPILVYVNPSTSHTLVAALSDAVLMSMVICNDTCSPIRIGQGGTCEDIVIQCLQCHFYTWRTVQQGTELRFSLASQDDKHWSHPIQVADTGNYPVQLTDDSGRRIMVIVIVKKLSSTMTQILISGEMIVYNNLENSVDLRLVSSSITERQRYITVNACGRAPSILLCPDVKYSIRLSLESQWSGLVPLHSTSNSWLVKIPSKDKKDFTSVWCQIFQDKDSKNKRTLVVISPMYLIKSMLPCDANVLVKTEELNVARTLKVPGRGTISNLLTPGTTTHNHFLTFHIDGNLPSSSPHVPLSYSAMDGKTPPPPAIPDVESLIDRIEMTTNETRWPFLESQWGKTEWGFANQPDTITHVKVKFCADRLQVANSLMVELQPWALVINTLGLGIALQSSERFLCALQHACVLAPPPVEGTFYLLVELNDGYHKSNSLQLSDSHSFYKPQISGLIPLTDSVRVKIQAPNSVIYATIHSKVAPGGVRILHVSSSFVISNLSDFDLRVAAFSVRRENCKFRVPSEILSFTINLPKNTSDSYYGQPLAEWHEIGYGPEASRRLYLIFERDGLVSNPIPVETKSERGVQTALLPIVSSCSSLRAISTTARTASTINVCLEVVFQAKDGVTYVSVDRQMCPQLIVHNRTRQLLAVAKSAKEQGGSAVDESEDWEWRFMLPGGTCGHYKFELDAANAALPPIVVSKPEYSGWSSPISLIPSAGARLVNLPHSSDLMASVVRVGYTVHLVLVYANHSLISAGDVRCRLSISSQHEPSRLPENEETLEGSDVLPDGNTCKDLDDLNKSAFSNLKVTCFLRGMTIMLCAEPDCSFHWQEVTALTVDNVAITVQPVTLQDAMTNELETRVTIWDLQIDNQEFQKGGYDFSVVLLRQGESDRSEFLGTNRSPEDLVRVARESGPAVDMTLLLNTNVRPALQEVSLEVAPLQIYVEDTYLTNLTNHLSKMIPTMLITGGKNMKPKEVASPDKSERNSRLEEEPIAENVNMDSKKEEEELLINVSDSEEGETALSLSPWKESQNQGSSSRQRRRGFTEDDTTVADEEEFVWMDDSADSTTPASSHTSIPIPEDVIRGSNDLIHPLRLKKFLIAPLSVLVSLHTSTKFYIALDQSPLSFSEFKRVDMITTPYRLGHALTLHYFLGAIYGTGWALGSLQLLGAPAGLARSVGHGLRSFLVLPYRGIMEGPTGFLLGVIHGSASLMKHVTAGTLTSVNKLAGSWSRTLDRLTLNAEDLKFAEEMRRNKPQGLAEGLRQGFTEFGVSVLGGVGGLAQQPMEYAAGTSSQSLVGSLGRGLVGVMARPISGAAELVALTAHGILSGAGWADTHLPKHQAICQGVHQGVESRIKYKLKLVPKGETLVFVCEATSRIYEPVVLVVTSFALYILNQDDVIIHQVKLQDLMWSKDKADPTAVKITVQTPDVIAERLSQKRISEFVRDSQRALSSVSPGSSLPPSPPHSADQEPLRFYLNPQRRDHFITLLDLAARHAAGKGFATFV